MCTSSKTHVDSEFQGSPAIKSLTTVGEVTDILNVFSNLVCCNTQTLPEFWVNFIHVTLLTPVFLKLLQWFWGNLWTTAIVCACNSSNQKNLWKQHAFFYGVC